MHPFKISLFFAIPMLIVGGILQWIGPMPEGQLMDGFKTTVLAFEFMQNAGETDQLFQVSNPTQFRNSVILGNTVDYLFMFFYSVFLGITGLGILKEKGERIMWLPIAICLIIFFADLLENATIASIVETYFQGGNLTASFYGNLHFFTWLKWGGIAAVFLIYAPYFYNRNWLGKVMAVLSILLLGLSIGAYLHRSVLNELMALTCVVLFVLTFVHNLIFRARAE